MQCLSFIMKKKVCVFTSSRADYNLLKPTLIKIRDSTCLDLQFIVTGSHLLSEYGNTSEIIVKDFNITRYMHLNSYCDKSSCITRIIGNEIIDCSDIFEDIKPDILLLLGDRFEMLAPAIVATIFSIPIIHLCGGDITLGSYDDYIRNTITMLADVHFPTSEDAAHRIQNFGKNKIIIAGHPCLEYLTNLYFYDQKEIELRLKIKFSNTNLLIVYHPETISKNSCLCNTQNIINFINKIKNLDISIFLIGSNIDTDNKIINTLFQELAMFCQNIYYFISLEQDLFLSLAKNCQIYLGNSSSGIYELPYIIPAIINVGKRQYGRLLASNILESDIKTEDLYNAFLKAQDPDFINKPVIYKYLSFDTSNIIYNYIINHY